MEAHANLSEKCDPLVEVYYSSDEEDSPSLDLSGVRVLSVDLNGSPSYALVPTGPGQGRPFVLPYADSQFFVPALAVSVWPHVPPSHP